MILRTGQFLHSPKEKNRVPEGTLFFSHASYLLAVLAHLGEALAAVDGAIGLGLEGNTSFAAAVGADSSEIFSGATGSILASVTASLAALGLVLEASLSVEFLLTGGEHELVATFLAN